MQAAQACSGDLIAFCDQDDMWHAEKLGRMQQPFQDPSVLLAYHNSTLIDDAGSAIGTVYRNRIRTKTFGPLALHPWTIIPGHAQVIRRSLVRLTPLHHHSLDPYCTTELMPHDQWCPFWASVLGTVIYIPECLAQYRQHGANLSGWPHIGWIAYVVDHISNAAKYVSGESLGARNRLELLRRCRDILHPDEMARIDSAISYYQGVSKRCEQRLAVYVRPTWHGRAKALCTLVRQGGYAGRVSGALGVPALLLDATVGIVFNK
jgi:glycosyltransferase involved in cell wall biosynthesis